MWYGFQTADENAAIGALVVYGIYKSRDVKRFKVTPEMWGMIEKGVRSSAMRAETIYDFIEKLKPKLYCASIQPRYMKTGDELAKSYATINGELVSHEEKGKKEFWTRILEEANHGNVLEEVSKHASRIVILVRERIEREKPLEAIFEKGENEDAE